MPHYTIPRDTVAQALYLAAFAQRSARALAAAGLRRLPVAASRYAAITGPDTFRPALRGWVFLHGGIA